MNETLCQLLTLAGEHHFYLPSHYDSLVMLFVMSILLACVNFVTDVGGAIRSFGGRQGTRGVR